MERKETRFSYVYQNLKKRILCGEFLPGSRMSSSRHLCEEYQVGMRTITDVLAALKKEGLIVIQPCRAAVVAQWKNAAAQPKELDILKMRNTILQVYQTFALLLPPLFTFASQNCDIQAQPHYKQAVKAARKGIAISGWRSYSAFGKDVLRSSGNLWFCEIYSLFDLYGDKAFFTEEYSYFSESFSRKFASPTDYLIDALCGKDPIKKFHQLSAIYQWLFQTVATSLKRLETDHPDYQIRSAVDFSWNALRGQDHYYLGITQDIENKIGTGIYPAGSFLPHEAALAEMYGVSVSTIRSALALLGQRGFSQTLNVKGTLVLTPDDSKASNALQNGPTKQSALRYLYALQLMVLLVKPVALQAASHITAADIAAISSQFKGHDRIYITDIMQHLLERLDLEPLRVIFSQVCKLTQWGYYISFYKNKNPAVHILNRKSLMAFRHLQNGDQAGFAAGLADCYRHVLDAVRKYMVEKYNFHEALTVRTPPKLPNDVVVFDT